MLTFCLMSTFNKNGIAHYQFTERDNFYMNLYTVTLNLWHLYKVLLGSLYEIMNIHIKQLNQIRWTKFISAWVQNLLDI